MELPTSPRGPRSSVVPMLALSAATRAVADEPALRPAAAALQRAACQLTSAREAALITIDWPARIARTVDGAALPRAVQALVLGVAATGRREAFDRAVLEPIGRAPSPSVLLVRGPRFAAHELALLAALVGGVAATLTRLIAASAASARP